MVQVAAASSAAPKLVPPVAEKKGGKKTKKSSKAIDKIGRRVAYIKALVEGLVESFAGQEDRLDPKSETAGLLTATVVHAKASAKMIDETSKGLFRLREVKWAPSNAARPFRAGDVASIRARHTERFTKHGAYALADIKGVKVESVHGEAAKIRSPKGELLGLVPFSWLTRDAK